jgi:hypothetical protein
MTGNDTFILIGGSNDDIFVLATGQGVDLISDFVFDQDEISLAGSLTFGQLTITQSGNNALIQVTSTGESLATVSNVSASSFDEGDFINEFDI